MNVKTHCMQVAVKAGKIELACKLALLANLENGNGVFVDNAKGDAMNAGMTAHQFAGGLAALTAKGVYTPSSDPEYRGKFGYYSDKE